MLRDFFHKTKSLKRNHQQPKEFTSDQDITKDGSNYFTTLSKDNINKSSYFALRFYTGNDYERINTHERTRPLASESLLKTSLWQHYDHINDIISKELQKNIVKKDLFVFKGINEERFYMMKKTGNTKSFWGLKGAIIRDRGFVSTSLLSSSMMHKSFVLKIKVPAGTRAAYISPLSALPDEKELLLDRDQSMVITGVKIKNGITTLECELLMPHSKNSSKL